jgi:hypothetical protein
MNVTDEMVDTACDTFTARRLSSEPLAASMKASIEAAMQAAWISVDDNLPEHGIVVLNQNSDKVRCRGGVWTKLVKYTVEDFLGEYSYPTDRWRYCEEGEVTHWMPLPEFKEIENGLVSS